MGHRTEQAEKQQKTKTTDRDTMHIPKEDSKSEGYCSRTRTRGEGGVTFNKI